MLKKILFILSMLLVWNCKNKPEKTANEQVIRTTLSVMSFNVLYTTSVESTYDCIKATDCDIIGLQETSRERIQQVADSLGFYYSSFRIKRHNDSNVVKKIRAQTSKPVPGFDYDDTGVISRYPIIKKKDMFAIIELPNNEKIAVTSVHLSPYPYEPYEIRDKMITVSEVAEISATRKRIPELTPVLDAIDSLKQLSIPVFITGDFNEPSHLDWTEKTVSEKMHFSMAVEWPCSKAISDIGLKDAYRLAHPDEIADNGITWTTNKSENEVYDRIDFVYHNLSGKLKLNTVKRVGRPDNDGEIKIPGYESDHFAVQAFYSFLD